MQITTKILLLEVELKFDLKNNLIFCQFKKCFDSISKNRGNNISIGHYIIQQILKPTIFFGKK